MKVAVLALLVATTPMMARAQTAMQADPRTQIVQFAPDRPMTLRTMLGGDILIMLPSGEHIQKITLDRPGDYQVRVANTADGLSLRQLRGLSQTGMEVETDRRHYDFTLTPTFETDVPYLVRIELPRLAPSVSPGTPKSGDLTAYKVSGSKALRPQTIGDDGLRTYITWGEGQLIPAVFAIDSLGKEEMVDGYMRDDIFTVDRVYPKLVFRIDRSAVFAIRQVKGSPRHGN